MDKPLDAHSGDHAHPPHLAHHFDTPVQQFDAATSGMWLFLATEILLFAGLFCAYAVYRSLHPEIFVGAAEKYLDKFWGATNTVVLLCSSFTMAAGVWAAQTSRHRMLIWMLVLTLLGGCGFLGIKFIEYKHKWEHHLLWGANFNPEEHNEHGVIDASHSVDASTTQSAESHAAEGEPEAASTAPAEAHAAESEPPPAAVADDTAAGWQYEPAASGPRGLLIGPKETPHEAAEEMPYERLITSQFFSIYFAMTGLHGVHVIVGMLIIAWLLKNALRRKYNAEYYTPVHLGGLYWHLVDLIWIYLFPLLYLIH